VRRKSKEMNDEKRAEQSEATIIQNKKIQNYSGLCWGSG